MEEDIEILNHELANIRNLIDYYTFESLDYDKKFRMERFEKAIKNLIARNKELKEKYEEKLSKVKELKEKLEKELECAKEGFIKKQIPTSVVDGTIVQEVGWILQEIDNLLQERS